VAQSRGRFQEGLGGREDESTGRSTADQINRGPDVEPGERDTEPSDQRKAELETGARYDFEPDARRFDQIRIRDGGLHENGGHDAGSKPGGQQGQHDRPVSQLFRPSARAAVGGQSNHGCQ